MGLVCVYTVASINTTPETARRRWFPQGLAENNKMLNIPPPYVMLVAFSAELASPKGKTTFSPWNTTLCETKTIEPSCRFSQCSSDLPPKSQIAMFKQSATWNFCLGSMCFRIFWICSWGKENINSDLRSGGGHMSSLTVCFSRDGYFFHPNRDSWGQQECLLR